MVTFPEELRWESAHGSCVGVRVSLHASLSGLLCFSACGKRLHPEECLFASRMTDRRAFDWLAGRIALREALKRFSANADHPILSSPRGAPQMPVNFSGSMSHKIDVSGTVAIALVSANNEETVGVDLEIVDEPRESIAPLVLTSGEVREVGNFPEHMRWFRILLHFSLKEAVYKAIDPMIQQYIDYQEASIYPTPDGKAEIQWHTSAFARGLVIDIRWVSRGKYILTSACMQKEN
jgi:enterobactin synthetase component D